LKLQILNHPKCRKFFVREENFLSSARGRSVDTCSKENVGLEFYFKQKIQDFREFLDECEKILPTETSLSPAKESVRNQKKVKQLKSWEVQGLSIRESLNKECTFDNTNLESKTVENTPRDLLNANQEYMKEKYNSSVKRSVNFANSLHEPSPQSKNINVISKQVRFENNELVSRQLFKDNQNSPVSANFASTKSSLCSNAPLKKKSKANKNGDQKEITQIPSRAVKIGKGHQSVAIPSKQNLEKKTHSKSSSVKLSTQQIKNKKTKDLENNEIAGPKIKRDKNGIRESSKSIVEVITLGKVPVRANSVLLQK